MSALSAPVRIADEVTPSDTVDLARGECRGLWIGVVGDLSVVMAGDGETRVFASAELSVGEFPFQVLRVNATGTTATSIKALY